MSNTLAYVISTCNRPELIEEFCVKVSEYYSEAFDIYVYDSSVSDETKKVVERYPYVKYVHIDNDIGLPEKVLNILKDFSDKESYDYIWLESDSLRYTKKGIKNIVDELSDDTNDLVVLDHFHYDGDNEVFYDIDLFFQKCVWMTTLLGSVMINRKTMIQNADWGLYYNIFCESEITNWSINYFYLYGVSVLDNPKVYLLNVCGEIRFSYLKKSNYWRNMAFELYCEEWPKLIEMLPACYTNRENVLRISAFEAIIGDIRAFKELRLDGVYSLKTFLKYRKIWDRISYIGRRKLFFISIVPSFFYKIPYVYRERSLRRRIHKLHNKYRTIIVYGMGANGYRFAKYAEKLSLKIDMYCTSKKKGEDVFCGYPVVDLDYIRNNHEDVGIILAMVPRNCKDVLRELRLFLPDDAYIYDGYMNMCLDYDLGYRYIAGNAWM